MNKPFNLLLEDSLKFYQGRQMKKALNTALIALEFGENGSFEDVRLATANILLANIYNTNGRYQNEPAFFAKALSSLEQAKNRIKSSPSLEISIEVLIVEGKIHFNKREFAQARQCYETARELANQNNKQLLLVKAISGLGQIAFAESDPNGTLELAYEVESLINSFSKEEQLSAKSEMYKLYSQAYILKQDYSQCLQMSQELLQLSRLIGDLEKEVIALRNIAVVCGVKSNYKIGMQYFLEALDKSEVIGFREMIVQIQINIGTLYAHLYNYEEAIRRYENILHEHSDVIDIKTKTIVFNNLGNIYLTAEQAHTAIGYFKEAYEMAKANDFYDLMAYSLSQLSRTKIALNNFEDAAADAYCAQQMFDEMGLVNGKQINMLNLSRLAYESENYQEAYDMAINAIELSQRIKDDTAEIKGYKLLAMIFKRKGEFEKALEYYERYTNIQEEFAKVKHSRYNLDMEIRHAIREKQKEIELLTKENEYQSQLIEKSDQITRQNEELLRVNDDLRQFAYIASHDLKEPLRMIGSFTQVIEKLTKPYLKGPELDYFKFVSEGVLRMNNLLDGLLRYSTVNQKQEEMTEVSLNDVLQICLANLKIRIVETETVIERGELPKLIGSHQLYVQLFQNLISNAIKFVKPGTQPYIKLTAEETVEAHFVHVTDNGIGISEANQVKIFDIFKRLHHQSEYEGTGIGLSICQKIAKRLGGYIKVHSVLGEGSTFTLVLPKTNHPA